MILFASRAALAASFLVVASPLVFASWARAQGTVQLVIEGEVAPEGGARIELEVAFESSAGGSHEERRTLGILVAQKTSAAEVAALLEDELVRAGARVVGAHPGVRDRARASFFVDRAYSIALRLGRGLTAQVCLCEEAPALVKLVPPRETKEPARLSITATTDHPITRDRGRVEFPVELGGAFTGEQSADVLTTAALSKGWTGQWLDHQAWRPQSLTTGARITGTCLRFESKGDWRIEIDLERDVAR